MTKLITTVFAPNIKPDGKFEVCAEYEVEKILLFKVVQREIFL